MIQMIEPVLRHTPLLGAGMQTTMMQLNRDAIDTGHDVVAAKMYASRDHVSNTGNETHVGTSEFSRNNREMMEVSVDAMSRIMEQDDEFEVSNFGNESRLGPTGFQNYNNFSYETKQQVAANAYQYFNG